MAIRKRISGNGLEDAAIRQALGLAIENNERRIAYLQDDIKNPFDDEALEEAEAELTIKRKHLAIWKRLHAAPGKLKVVAQED